MDARFTCVSGSDDVATTVAALTHALAEREIEVFAVIDHAAGARAAGLELDDEVVVIFGNPMAGTRLMQADRRMGIELPLRILIWREGGATKIGYDDPHAFADEYEVSPGAPVLDAMGSLLGQLVEQVA